jgi:uncharacterized protein YecE (DUF72 family)
MAHPDRASKHRIRVGPAGWSYPDWNGFVYPSRRSREFHEATFLADFFDTIEINTSFYQPMQPKSAEQWIERVHANPGFKFTAKLWRRFTHESKPTTEEERIVRAGFAPLVSAEKLGAVLMQFPFSFHQTPENNQYLQLLLDRFADYPLVVEVRHASWNVEEFFAMLHARGVGFCNIDQPMIGRSMKPMEKATAAIGYVRLHGQRYDTWFSDDPNVPSSERYNYLYSPEELETWATRIRHVANHAETTYVITNNHYEGKGVVNALELIHLLGGKKLKIPETLRCHYPRLDAIADEPPREPSLFG